MFLTILLQYACDPTGTTRSVVEVREGPGFSRGAPEPIAIGKRP